MVLLCRYWTVWYHCGYSCGPDYYIIVNLRCDYDVIVTVRRRDYDVIVTVRKTQHRYKCYYVSDVISGDVSDASASCRLRCCQLGVRLYGGAGVTVWSSTCRRCSSDDRWRHHGSRFR